MTALGNGIKSGEQRQSAQDVRESNPAIFDWLLFPVHWWCDHVQIEIPFTHLNADAPHTEHLYLVVHAGHEPEELLAVLVPLDRVELGALEVVVTAQTGARAQDQLTRHCQPLHAQGPAALIRG